MAIPRVPIWSALMNNLWFKGGVGWGEGWVWGGGVVVGCGGGVVGGGGGGGGGGGVVVVVVVGGGGWGWGEAGLLILQWYTVYMNEFYLEAPLSYMRDSQRDHRSASLLYVKFHHNEFSKYKNNIRKTWATLKEIITKKTYASDFITRGTSWGPDHRNRLFESVSVGIWTPHSPVLIQISADNSQLNQLPVNFFH